MTLEQIKFTLYLVIIVWNLFLYIDDWDMYKKKLSRGLYELPHEATRTYVGELLLINNILIFAIHNSDKLLVKVLEYIYGM
jgi:hypothetical protein